MRMEMEMEMDKVVVVWKGQNMSRLKSYQTSVSNLFRFLYCFCCIPSFNSFTPISLEKFMEPRGFSLVSALGSGFPYVPYLLTFLWILMVTVTLTGMM